MKLFIIDWAFDIHKSMYKKVNDYTVEYEIDTIKDVHLNTTLRLTI